MYPGQVVHCALDQVEYRPKLRLQTARSQYKERHSPPPHLCPGPGPPRRPWSLRRHCHCAQSRQSSVSSFSACRTFWCEGVKEEKSSGLRKTFSATDTPDQYTDRTAAMLTGAAPLNCPAPRTAVLETAGSLHQTVTCYGTHGHKDVSSQSSSGDWDLNTMTKYEAPL